MSQTSATTANEVWKRYLEEWEGFFREKELSAEGDHHHLQISIGDLLRFECQWFPKCCGVLVVSCATGVTSRSYGVNLKTQEGLIRFIEKFAIHAGHGMVMIVGCNQKSEVKNLLEKLQWVNMGEFRNPYHGMRQEAENSNLTVWNKQIAEETTKLFKEHPELDTF